MYHYSQVFPINLAKYHTYAILPDADTLHKDFRVRNDTVTRSILQDACDEMTIRGYKPDVVQPDLLLLVHILLVQKQDSVKIPVSASYPAYYKGFNPSPFYPFYYTGYKLSKEVQGNGLKAVYFKDGCLVVDVIDRKTMKLLWRGWSEANEFPVDMLTNDIRHKLEGIFRQYPAPVLY